ncbi:hypothetical protein BJ912DRAFT_1058847 [Pholiota molesta]|nr:hypothetical protein BJ912DRAFT_1058847 [Pholiota molesta]
MTTTEIHLPFAALLIAPRHLPPTNSNPVRVLQPSLPLTAIRRNIAAAERRRRALRSNFGAALLIASIRRTTTTRPPEEPTAATRWSITVEDHMECAKREVRGGSVRERIYGRKSYLAAYYPGHLSLSLPSQPGLSIAAIPGARDGARPFEVRRNGQRRPYEAEHSGRDTMQGRIYAQADDPFAPQGTKGTPPPDACAHTLALRPIYTPFRLPTPPHASPPTALPRTAFTSFNPHDHAQYSSQDHSSRHKAQRSVTRDSGGVRLATRRPPAQIAFASSNPCGCVQRIAVTSQPKTLATEPAVAVPAVRPRPNSSIAGASNGVNQPKNIEVGSRPREGAYTASVNYVSATASIWTYHTRSRTSSARIAAGVWLGTPGRRDDGDPLRARCEGNDTTHY